MKRVLALVLAGAAAAPAAAAFAPRRGAWEGSARAGEHRDPVTARVVRRDGRLFLGRLTTLAHDRCGDPGGGPAVTFERAFTVRRMRVRPDRTFEASEGDLEVRGRFTSRGRAEGTISVAPEGLTCTGSEIRFVLRPAG